MRSQLVNTKPVCGLLALEDNYNGTMKGHNLWQRWRTIANMRAMQSIRSDFSAYNLYTLVIYISLNIRSMFFLPLTSIRTTP